MLPETMRKSDADNSPALPAPFAHVPHTALAARFRCGWWAASGNTAAAWPVFSLLPWRRSTVTESCGNALVRIALLFESRSFCRRCWFQFLVEAAKRTQWSTIMVLCCSHVEVLVENWIAARPDCSQAVCYTITTAQFAILDVHMQAAPFDDFQCWQHCR